MSIKTKCENENKKNIDNHFNLLNQFKKVKESLSERNNEQIQNESHLIPKKLNEIKELKYRLETCKQKIKSTNTDEYDQINIAIDELNDTITWLKSQREISRKIQQHRQVSFYIDQIDILAKEFPQFQTEKDMIEANDIEVQHPINSNQIRDKIQKEIPYQDYLQQKFLKKISPDELMKNKQQIIDLRQRLKAGEKPTQKSQSLFEQVQLNGIGDFSLYQQSLNSGLSYTKKLTKTVIQTGASTVHSGLSQGIHTLHKTLTSNEQKLNEEKRKQLFNKKFVKTQEYLKNSKIMNELNQKIFLSKKEIEQKRKNQGQDILQNERDEADQIEESMIQMAKGMKELANNFKAQFKEDEKKMSQIGNVQDENLKKTEAERKKMNERLNSTFMGFWQKLFTLIIGMVVFVFMMWFIWLFPSKIKNSNVNIQSQSYIGSLITSIVGSIGRGLSNIAENQQSLKNNSIIDGPTIQLKQEQNEFQQ